MSNPCNGQTGYSLLITRYVFQLAIQIFSITMTPVGAIQSGMSGQDNYSDGTHNEMTQLTMVLAIFGRESNGQFCFRTP